MFDIALNEKGSRYMHITEENLLTIKKYDLFNGLINSTGYITESDSL